MAALNMRPYLRRDVLDPVEYSMWEVRAREGSLVDSTVSRLSQEVYIYTSMMTIRR
jgi:hypothetical protein